MAEDGFSESRKGAVTGSFEKRNISQHYFESNVNSFKKRRLLFNTKELVLNYLLLPPHQQQQLQCLGKTAFSCCPELILVSKSITWQVSDNPRCEGIFPIGKRINHSCRPNSEMREAEGSITCTAIKDISVGEEITYSYLQDYEGLTSEERQQALGFNCKCSVCTKNPRGRLLSDMRRRLIRGIQILFGIDFGNGKYNTVVINPVLRKRGELFEIPLSSKLIYDLPTMLLLEQEGLLTDATMEKHNDTSTMVARWFDDYTNRRIALGVILEKTPEKKFRVANQLWGRADPRDRERARYCQKDKAKVLKMYDQGIDITNPGLWGG